ncbi:MAG: polysaccharide deacetylase family protein, partial [Chloroflexi bacterium]|nr:polysaccharide deacetylase family protein [Chloroflexota bacterium]
MKAIFLACLLVTPLWPGFFTRPAGRPACRQTCGGPGGQRARGGYGERRYVKIQGGAAPAQIVSQGSGRGKVIALTFDAGADTGFAAQILQTLERDHVTATFGMTGRWARANLPLLRRMARDRDQIINHTYDHRSFTGLSTRTAPLSAAQRAWEINQTDRLVRSVTGHTTRPYFRPPYG